MINKYSFILKGRNICIEVEQSHRPNFLSTGIYRSFEYTLPGLTGIPENSILKDDLILTETGEFLQDVQFQIDYLNANCQSPLSESDLVKSLAEACRIHITKYGRLIDSDLFALTNCNMFILKAISNYPTEKMKQIYSAMIQQMISLFGKYIWINRYVGINSIGLEPLVKTKK